MAPEEMASSIRTATALMPQQRALEDELLGPLAARYKNQQGQVMMGGMMGMGQYQLQTSTMQVAPQAPTVQGRGVPATAVAKGKTAGGASRNTNAGSNQSQQSQQYFAANYSHQPQPYQPSHLLTLNTHMPPQGGPASAPGFVGLRRSSSAPPAPPLLIPGVNVPNLPSVPMFAPPSLTSPVVAAMQNARIGAGPQRRQQGQQGQAGGPTRSRGNTFSQHGGATPYSRPGTASSTSSNNGTGGASRKNGGGGGAGQPGPMASTRTNRAMVPMPIDLPSAPLMPSIGRPPQQQQYQQQQQQRYEDDDDDPSQVIAHLEAMKRNRGEAVSLFNPDFHFPTAPAAASSPVEMAPTATPSLGGRRNGTMFGASAGGRGGYGGGGAQGQGQYQAPNGSMDNAAFQQQQALFGNQNQNRQHQQLHQTQTYGQQQQHSHQQQLASPHSMNMAQNSYQQSPFDSHPQQQQQEYFSPSSGGGPSAGVYVNGQNLDDFALATGMELDGMAVDPSAGGAPDMNVVDAGHLAFGDQQMQIREAFEQFEVDSMSAGGNGINLGGQGGVFDPSQHHQHAFNTMQQQQHNRHVYAEQQQQHIQPPPHPTIEFAADYSMGVPTPPAGGAGGPLDPSAGPSSSSRMLPRQINTNMHLPMRPGTGGLSAASSPSSASAQTPAAVASLPLRLPTPSDGGAVSDSIGGGVSSMTLNAVVPTPRRQIDLGRISASGEAYFDWNAASATSPLPPHSGGHAGDFDMQQQHALDQFMLDQQQQHPSNLSSPFADVDLGGEMKFDFPPPDSQQHGGHHHHQLDPLSGLPNLNIPLSPLDSISPHSALPDSLQQQSMFGFNMGFGTNSFGGSGNANLYNDGGFSMNGNWMTGLEGMGSGASNGGSFGSASGLNGASRRLSHVADPAWFRRGSAAGDLAGVGLGEF